tara:strand:+ start:22038 stop:22949 length:912 start_codon:yes stop_codon:yes gene_type:complete
VIAIMVSDLHLTLNAPICRKEDDWLDVQAGYLQQLKTLQEEHSNCPIFCAGDIFDKWNPPHELVNFALEHLPDNMLTVPGQHDLPNHRIEDMHRSGYGVLVNCGKISDLSGGACEYLLFDTIVRGFGWGEEIEPLEASSKFRNMVLMAHEYIWIRGKSYPGASNNAKLTDKKSSRFFNYTHALFGDNHKGFLTKCGKCQVYNNGTFIRRKSDEIVYEPTVALLYEEGDVQIHHLDTRKDEFVDAELFVEKESVDITQFIEELKGMQESGLNFVEAVENHIRSDGKKLSKETKNYIIKALKDDE